MNIVNLLVMNNMILVHIIWMNYMDIVSHMLHVFNMIIVKHLLLEMLKFPYVIRIKLTVHN